MKKVMKKWQTIDIYDDIRYRGRKDFKWEKKEERETSKENEDER